MIIILSRSLLIILTETPFNIFHNRLFHNDLFYHLHNSLLNHDFFLFGLWVRCLFLQLSDHFVQRYYLLIERINFLCLISYGSFVSLRWHLFYDLFSHNSVNRDLHDFFDWDFDDFVSVNNLLSERHGLRAFPNVRVLWSRQRLLFRAVNNWRLQRSCCRLISAYVLANLCLTLTKRNIIFILVRLRPIFFHVSAHRGIIAPWPHWWFVCSKRRLPVWIFIKKALPGHIFFSLFILGNIRVLELLLVFEFHSLLVIPVFPWLLQNVLSLISNALLR